MSLYFVVALAGSANAIEAAVNKTLLPQDVFKIEDGKWVIDIPVTISKEVSEKLEISATANHFVVPTRAGYYGRAQGALWEWIAAKANQPSA